MKVILLRKMAGLNAFHPAGSVLELAEKAATVLIANRAAQMIGPDGKPIPLPDQPPKGGK